MSELFLNVIDFGKHIVVLVMFYIINLYPFTCLPCIDINLKNNGGGGVRLILHKATVLYIS